MTTKLFSQSQVSCLTKEEECLLKTALAVVVIRKRKFHVEAKSDAFNNNDDPSPPSNSLSFLLDSVFKPKSSTKSGTLDVAPSSSPSLLKTVNHIHMDQIFQVARSMVAMANGTITRGKKRNDNNCGGRNNTNALKGTASHLAQQLQAWLIHLESEERKNQEGGHSQEQNESSSSSSNGTRAFAAATFHTRPSHWIRAQLSSSLVLLGGSDDDNESTFTIRTNFAVFQAIVGQATHSSLVSTILSVLVTMLRELYYDKFIVVSASGNSSKSKKNKTTPTSAFSTRKVSSSKSLDVLATLSLRLVKTCLGWYQQRQMTGGIEILHQCLATTTGSGTENYDDCNMNNSHHDHEQDILIPLTISKLPRIYCDSCRPGGTKQQLSLFQRVIASSQMSSRSATTTNSGGAVSMTLDPAAKLLLRHTLYCIIRTS